MKLKIEIDCDNAAFEDNGIAEEAATILLQAARKLRDDNTEGPLFDSNGNRVGRFWLEE